MKMRELSVLAGVAAPLILTGTASAGFVGVKTVLKEAAQASGLFVCNVYAIFDRPDDEFSAAAGTTTNPMDIHVVGGDWYQDPQGSPLTAPFLQFLPGTSGLLAYDTFVTIGTKVDDLFSTLDNVSTTPGLAFTANSIGGQNVSWFIVPAGPGNGGLGAPDANGQVLIFQGSFVKAPEGPTGIEGTLLLQFTSNGETGQQAVVEFSHLIPSPGALALLGMAGLGLRRRRR